MRLPSTRSELDWVLQLLKEDRVLVHTGWFYDFSSEPFIVLSLLTPPAVLAEGLSRLERPGAPQPLIRGLLRRTARRTVRTSSSC